ncbi:BOI-related E3 ubiquitin-protein ligase 1-like protein, partial [Tanacetum coccineum]
GSLKVKDASLKAKATVSTIQSVISMAGDWELCTYKIRYYHDVGSMITYHKNLTARGYHALIFRFVDKQPREVEANLMQKKVQISLNQNYYNEESDRPSSMPNPHDVSTGLKLSYDDEERNSSITSKEMNVKL